MWDDPLRDLRDSEQHAADSMQRRERAALQGPRESAWNERGYLLNSRVYGLEDHLRLVLVSSVSLHFFASLWTVATGGKIEEQSTIANNIFHVGGDVTAPKAIHSPEPEFSEAARKAGYQGTCVLSLVVGADGRPRDIRVVRKLGMQLDEKAIQALNEWKFEPAQKGGKPVAVAMEAGLQPSRSKRRKQADVFR